jgi:hypothetical protein
VVPGLDAVTGGDLEPGHVDHDDPQVRRVVRDDREPLVGVAAVELVGRHLVDRARDGAEHRVVVDEDDVDGGGRRGPPAAGGQHVLVPDRRHRQRSPRRGLVEAGDDGLDRGQEQLEVVDLPEGVGSAGSAGASSPRRRHPPRSPSGSASSVRGSLVT